MMYAIKRIVSIWVLLRKTLAQHLLALFRIQEMGNDGTNFIMSIKKVVRRVPGSKFSRSSKTIDQYRNPRS